jgi:hypothetical protein
VGLDGPREAVAIAVSTGRATGKTLIHLRVAFIVDTCKRRINALWPVQRRSTIEGVCPTCRLDRICD